MVAGVPGTQPLHKFRVELHTPWLFETMRSIPSAWPHKFELEKPLVISNLQLCPVKWTEVPISVQLQIYGNREGMCGLAVWVRSKLLEE